MLNLHSQNANSTGPSVPAKAKEIWNLLTPSLALSRTLGANLLGVFEGSVERGTIDHGVGVSIDGNEDSRAAGPFGVRLSNQVRK